MLGEKVILKVFLELTPQKLLINFIILPNIIYSQTRTTIRDGLQIAMEKNQNPRGKQQNFIINYER